MKKRGWRTAGELMAELERNPEFVARRAEQERRRRQIADALRELEAPLVEALAQVGEHVTSVWDLVNTSRPYPHAIDMLLEHLQRPYPEAILEGIARALAVPDSRRIWTDLVRLYRAHETTPVSVMGVKGALACALMGAADESVVDDILALIRDEQHGSARVGLVATLARLKDPRAHDELVALQSHPTLGLEARASLKKLRRRKPPRLHS